jgi:hypothetical protein
MNPPKWTLRAIAGAVVVLAAVTAAPHASAQPRNNNANPFRLAPGGFVQGGLVPPVPIVQPIQPVIFQPQFGFNPFVINAALNPAPFVPNPFIAGPFQINPLNNPFNNPFVPQFVPNQFGNPFVNPFGNPFFQPTIAFQQPGRLFWRGPDFQVNPFTGTVVRPFTGVAQTADGSVFFQLSRRGIPTVFDTFGPRTNIYVNPETGALFNPNTGVIVRPGTNGFGPWIR